MLKCKKEKLLVNGSFDEVTIVRKGFMKYEVVRRDGTTVAKGIKLRKYRNASRGFLCRGGDLYGLFLENPNMPNHFNSVCVWR